MAYIKVDHSKFEAAASAIDAYIDYMKKEMASAEEQVVTLSAYWEGRDYAQFKAQWDTVTGADSVYMNYVKALESYAKFLRFAGKKYRDTQANAINSANGLPKY